jgi:hypothetical protein
MSTGGSTLETRLVEEIEEITKVIDLLEITHPPLGRGTDRYAIGYRDGLRQARSAMRRVLKGYDKDECQQ